jgi:hypothetical protein
LALQTPKFYLAGSKRARESGFLRSIGRKNPQFEQALRLAKQWGNELVELTRRELEDMPSYTDPSGKLHWLIGNVDLRQGAHFKNIDRW